MAMADRDAATQAVIDRLKTIYRENIMPVEKLFSFEYFYSPPLTDSEFESKPNVLMVGQYSTGKTSFIKYIVGKEFPGIRVGPEPTTDRFVAVMDGPDERVIPGNALAVAPHLPYSGLQQFGVNFLNRFEGAQLPSDVLRNISIVDTPGVLSGEKQRLNRGYEFTSVCKWFAARSDLILLLFDAHKLDISDEFKSVIQSLKGHEDKIRCILNKADQVDRQKLMRVYGALMWSLGKVVENPEVLKVYVGSFWDQPLRFEDNAELFEMEERDLMNDLRDLPRNSAVRKINELVKRTRLLKVHVHLLSYLKEQMPTVMGKEKKQKELIANMANVFRNVQRQYNLAAGDFPDLDMFVSKCPELTGGFSALPKLNKKNAKLVEAIDKVLSVDVPALMESLPQSTHEEEGDVDASTVLRTENIPQVPVPSATKTAEFPSPEPVPAPNPFAGPWALESLKESLVADFDALKSEDGKMDANAAAGKMRETGVAQDTLFSIWNLADIDKSGKMDLEEFTIAMHYCSLAGEGEEIPETLPSEIIPPNRR